MNPSNRQQGMTLIGWLFTLVLVGGVALLVLKLVPVYVEKFKVEKALHAVAQEVGPQVSKPEVYRRFMRRMDVEDVDRFTKANLHKFLEVEKKGNTVTLTLEYQSQPHLFHNIWLLIKFKFQASNR